MIPIDQKFELDVLDAVGFEDAAHFREANLVGGGVDVRVNQADAVPTSLRCRFHSVLEAEGADFGRTEGIDIAREREISGDEFDFGAGHVRPLESDDERCGASRGIDALDYHGEVTADKEPPDRLSVE